MVMIDDHAAELGQLNVWRAHLAKACNNTVSRILKHLGAKVHENKTFISHVIHFIFHH